MLRRLKSLLLDLLVLSVIIAIGYSLTYFWSNQEHIITGYQDWYYHAFRIKRLETAGIDSWDHIWANGLNHWRSYQYLPHYLTLGIQNLFQVSPAQALVYTTVFAFIAIRILSYIVLRSIGIKRLYAFIAVVISYSFLQQWIAIKDYSIHLVMITLPLILYVFQNSQKNGRVQVFLSAVAGFCWALHPILAMTVSSLQVLNLLFNKTLKSISGVLAHTLIFMSASAPFWIPYLTIPYKFSNPLYSSTEFIRLTLPHDYLGLNRMYAIGIILSFGTLFFKSNKTPRWTKILFLHSLLIIGLVLLGFNDLTPRFVNQFQISRLMIPVGYLLTYVFASTFQTLLTTNKKSLFIQGILLASTTGIFLSSLEHAATHAPSAITTYDNPVATYFADKEIPKGSVYFDDDSEAAYFTEDIRLVGSYNDHLLPGPIPFRIKNLLKSQASLAGVSPSYVNLVTDYARVTGLEYLFLPKTSLLGKALIKSEAAPFVLEDSVTVQVGDRDYEYVVIKRNEPIINAFWVPAETDTSILTQIIPDPVLDVSSFQPWDEAVHQMAETMYTQSSVPISLSFQNNNVLALNLSRIPSDKNGRVFVNQSFDTGWKANTDISLSNSSLRHMTFETTATTPEKISFQNNWPKWHWPVQLMGIATLIAVFYATSISYIMENWNILRGTKKDPSIQPQATGSTIAEFFKGS